MSKTSQILWAKLYALGNCTLKQLQEHGTFKPEVMLKLEMLRKKAEVRKDTRKQLTKFMIQNGLAKKMLRVL
jgi:hypothetical protein